MFIDVKSITSFRSDGQRTTKNICLLKCDACKRQFERPFKTRLVKRSVHFCSVNCVNSCMKSLVEDGLFQKHGVKNSWHIPGVLARVRATVKINFDVDYPMQSPIVEQRRRENSIVKYGVDNVAKTDSVRRKLRENNAQRDWSLVQERTIATLQKRYGENVTSTFQLPHVIASHQTPEAWARRIATMHRNGSFNKSKPEDVAFELLVSKFGVENIKRWQLFPGTKWPIDIHVLNPDVWIQVDGVYWHGLDVDSTTLQTYAFGTKRQQAIYGNYVRDRKQDVYASEHNIKLLRITDKAIKSDVTCVVNALEGET